MDTPRPDVPHVSPTHEGVDGQPISQTVAQGPIVTDLYGLMAEFKTDEALAEVARAARHAGYQKMDAYTPFPSHEVMDAVGVRGTRLPLIVLVGGILGLLGGYFLQYYTAVIDYPLNVGGRPLHSWVSFLPVTFETTVLLAALAAIFGMLALNGLPMPYHPVFNVEEFSDASRDRFFLVIETTDPKFDYAETRRFLESMAPEGVMDVPN